ncbi:acyl-coenzyme A thioesterase 2, chloroplastic [Vitis vinifera]|uniref:HotDog ACOT-type domain-containing protein n=1 Tax=Vitis vinifera TaxID=29760 RepID=F6HAX8_VITVI|nr:acyl-coenzyme A thioesterase 2, chloroplastic [Vitis vinifera]|eukprot:XP_002275033.1 PREDICTED: acyl-coenzyme A thioesterase 9, mitochondrial [Vitis vinifera]
MKPIIRGPLSHHLFFRLTTSSSIFFSTSNLSINTPSLHTLSSFHLLTLSPSNTHFPISPNQPTPHHQFTHRRPFSSVRSDPSSIEPPPPNAIPVVSTVASPFESSPSIDAGSLIRKPISLWPGMYHSPVTNALWEARSSIFEKSQELPSDAASESELVPKTPAQSRTSIIYKFSSDYILREQYRNPWNEIRSGKLLEDLDALAGTISFKHCSNDKGAAMPFLLVTASVDRMVLKKPIRVDTDLKIVGAVTWVGRSSMEIRLEVIQPTPEASDPSDSLALTANFTFVARDSKTGKSAPINQISPETQQEKLLWREAEDRNQMRKKKRGENMRGLEDREADRLEALLAEGRVFCDMPALADRDSILIRDTRLEYTIICQPQQRNIHGRIFGGFLMRKALELAFSTTYAFAGAAPLFVEADHVDFLKPVDVGNFLRLKSCVLYTELENPTRPLINVEVVAHVTRPELRSSEVSNTFYFTFTARPEAMKDGLKIRSVVPATEEEARRVLKRMDAENPELVQTRN